MYPAEFGARAVAAADVAAVMIDAVRGAMNVRLWSGFVISLFYKSESKTKDIPDAGGRHVFGSIVAPG